MNNKEDNKNTREKQADVKPVNQNAGPAVLLLLIPGIALVTWAILLRAKTGTYSYPFYDLESGKYSARFLTEDIARPAHSLWVIFKKQYLPMFLKDYVLPVYALLLPGIAFITAGISGLPAISQKKYFEFLENTQKEKIFLAVLGVLVFAGVLTSHFMIMQGAAPITDEFSYRFQGNLIAHGKLYAESPPSPDSFSTLNIVNDGKWYSKYTIGWPLMLAAGRIFGMDYVVGPLCAAFTIILLYLVASKVFNDKKAGVAAAFFGALSPYILLLYATYFPHSAVGVFSLLYIYSLLRSIEDKEKIWIIPAGVAITMLMLTRPADAALVFAGYLPFLLWFIIKAASPKKALLRLAPMFLFMVAGVGVLMWVNYIQNGDPFLFSFLKYRSVEKWGFGTFGHSPAKGLWNLVFPYMRASYWSVPFITLFTAVSIFRKESKVFLFLCVPAVFAAFYFGYYGMGAMDLGARFFLPAFLALIITASGGAAYLTETMKKREIPAAGIILPALIVSSIFFMVFGIYKPFFPHLANRYKEVIKLADHLKNPEGVKGKSLIFLREDPSSQNAVFTRNSWQYEDEENLVILYLKPEVNEFVIKSFPDRKPYLMVYDFRRNRYVISPQFENSKSSYNYMMAAENYSNGVFNDGKEKAVECIETALRLDPGNANILLRLGQAYIAVDEYVKALPIFERLAQIPQFRDVRYLLGRNYGQLGEYEKAIEALEEFIEVSDEQFMKVKTRKWINRYKEEMEKRN